VLGALFLVQLFFLESTEWFPGIVLRCF